MNQEYKVVEHFVSINGEGILAGQLALFIRFQGCNLNCSYCDTKWANQKDTPCEVMTKDELCQLAVESQIHNITLTGGEPLLQEEIEYLIAELLERGLHVEIETNGSVRIEPVRNKIIHLLTKKDRIAELSFTVDYKLISSEMESHMQMENYTFLRKNDTVKFVSGSIEDLKRAEEIIGKYQLHKKCHVYISPVYGAIDAADIVEYMKTHYMNGINLQLQLHKFIWDPAERGV